MVGRTKWRLPPELDSMIIDYLLDDKPALASCSLVCSRWLPRSRKHLFRAIVVEPSRRRGPHYELKDFLEALKRSRECNPEWAIGTSIKNVMIDGPGLTCPLSFLWTLVSDLPQLSSLHLADLVVLDDLSQEVYGLQSQRARFKLDKLFVSDCIAQAGDLKHILGLLCMFSSIRELSMMNLWHFKGNRSLTPSLTAFAIPTIQSLSVDSVSDFHVMGVFYTLLTDSPSVKNAHLTRIVLSVWTEEELSVFSDFARFAGAALQEVELHAGIDYLDHQDGKRRPSSVLLDLPFTCHVSAFDAWSLPTCPVFRSLVLCIECNIAVNPPSPSMARLNAERTPWTLGANARILQRHRDAFPALTILRLEMLPGDQRMAEALIHATWGGNRGQVQGDTAQSLTEDVLDEWMWESLEDVVCGFPVLKHMELACTGDLMEGTKAELRDALEKRLPRLWQSGTAQLVTDHRTVQPHWW